MAWTWTKTLVLAGGIGVLAMLGWDDCVKLLHMQPLGIDFMPMWAAGHEIVHHPGRVYDFTALTRFQHPLLAGFQGPRPFVYPPTALVLFAPFGLASFSTANAIWTAGGLLAILWAMAGPMPRPLLLAAMALMPASVLVMITGQVTFLIAAMTITAILNLEKRPILAGVLFGLAGVIKPQAMALLPVALVASGQWRAMAATALTAGIAVVASLLAFGAKTWALWFAALGKFDQWVMAAPALERGMITPTALGTNLHLDPGGLDGWRVAFGIGAVLMVWMVFRRTQDPARRLVALLGGGLFISPYAMHYDGALLAPAAALMLANRPSPGAWIAAFAASVVLCFAAIPHWGAAAVTAFTLFAALTPATAFGGRWRVAEFAGKSRAAPPEPVHGLEGVDRA